MIFLASGFIAIAATKTALILGSTANIRPRILRYDVSTQGVPTSDQSVEFQVRRATALGTSTAYTLQASDPSDTAVTPVLTAGTNCSVEPTYAAGSWLADKGINPRQTHQWVAYSPDEEVILPATASNGVGWQITSAGGGAGNLLVNTSVRQ
jgi:hypothetical protein